LTEVLRSLSIHARLRLQRFALAAQHFFLESCLQSRFTPALETSRAPDCYKMFLAHKKLELIFLAARGEKKMERKR
jgi:hypothetical protein